MINELFERELQNTSINDVSLADYIKENYVPKKSGKWINDKDDMPTCSKCGYIPPYSVAIDDYEYSNYCPNCGVRMESEDKE